MCSVLGRLSEMAKSALIEYTRSMETQVTSYIRNLQKALTCHFYSQGLEPCFYLQFVSQ